MDTVNSDMAAQVAHIHPHMQEQNAAEKNPYAVELGERIRVCRGTTSRGDFAERLGLHANTVGKFERGLTMPDAQTVLRIAELGNRTAQWLLTGAGPLSTGVEKNVKAVETDEFVYVPHFDVQMSAGHGTFGDVETVMAMRPFDIAFIRGELGIRHDELALVTVVGSSMEPHLKSHDTVLLDLRSQDVQTEGIHAIRLDGAMMIKRVQRLPGRVLRVSSSNPEYLPFDVAGTDDVDRDFVVLGRVRWGGVTFN